MFEVKEHKFCGATWIAIRARGSEWSWLQPSEAADLAKILQGYAGNQEQMSVVDCAPITGTHVEPVGLSLPVHPL